MSFLSIRSAHAAYMIFWALALHSVGCAQSRDAEFALIVERSVSTYIIPSYRHLLEATIELTSATSSFCERPNPDGQQKLVRAFANTIEAWASVDFLRFGPMARNGRYERFSYWPDPRRTGARQLRQLLAREDASVLTPGALEPQSAAIQGLPAFEALLFSGEDAVVSTHVQESFRCKLAVAVARNINSLAAIALSGWIDGKSWALTIQNPSVDNPVYRTHSEAMIEILRAVLTAVEQDLDVKLLPGLGNGPEETNIRHMPYSVSEQTLPYLRASARALRTFVGTTGLLALTRGQGGIEGAVEQEFSTLEAALNEVDGNLEIVLAGREGRTRLVEASVALKNLSELFHGLAPMLGLTVVYNALDGD